MNLSKRWHDYWFGAESPNTLACVRIVLFGLLFIYYLPVDFRLYADPAMSLFWRPVFPFLLISLPPATADAVAAFQVVWKVSLLLACVGLLTRPATLVAFLLGFYLLGVAQSYAVMTHVDAAIPLALGVMAAARSNHALALDMYFWRHGAMLSSGEYRWPVQVLRLITVFVLFNGGLSKLRHGGFDWVFSDNLSILLLQNQHYFTPQPPLTSLGVELAPYVWLTQILALGTLLVELAIPLALVSLRARWLLIPSVCLMFVTIRLLLGPNFTPYLICLVACWPAWNQLARRVPRSLPVAKIVTARMLSRI